MKDDGGKSRGFGFVSYETHEAAKKVRFYHNPHDLIKFYVITYNSA